MSTFLKREQNLSHPVFLKLKRGGRQKKKKDSIFSAPMKLENTMHMEMFRAS